jgi:hypothetical protein
MYVCTAARAIKKRGAGPFCINVMDVMNMGDGVVRYSNFTVH